MCDVGFLAGLLHQYYRGVPNKWASRAAPHGAPQRRCPWCCSSAPLSGGGVQKMLLCNNIITELIYLYLYYNSCNRTLPAENADMHFKARLTLKHLLDVI